MQLLVKTGKNKEIIDITDQVAQKIPQTSGIINIFIKHTTAALTAADLDPGTDEDFLEFLQSLVPNINWRHPHNPAHAPDHLLSSLIGSSVTIPVERGQIQLGAWQRVILVELDGPREREIHLSFVMINA